MQNELRHNCGLCVAHTLENVYSMIESLQHRGREATGIAAIGDSRIDVIKWKGPVNRFDIVDLHNIFPSTNYHTYMAHVRYATRGRKDKILEDAHPHVIGGKKIERGSHIIIQDCDIAGVHNGQVGSEYFGGVYKSLLITGCDTEALLYYYQEKGAKEILKQIPLSYTMAIADKRIRDVIVLRDRTGIKPGVLGLMDGKYGVSSEDVAYLKKGGEFIKDLEPGVIYYLDSKGGYRKEMVISPRLAYCFFEYNYIAHVNSIINGVSVRRVRELLGEQLANEFHFEDADFVTYLPRCPKVAARKYAIEKKLPFIPTLYKMRGERAFQGSTSDERKNSIEQNLFLIPDFKNKLPGKKVISIDDSQIRGNNSKRERELLYEEAGTETVYHINYTPPIGIIGKDGIPRGCMFGVDMPPDDDFIARGRTSDDISEIMNMPTYFISVEGMLSVFEKLGLPINHLCTYCIGGKNPAI